MPTEALPRPLVSLARSTALSAIERAPVAWAPFEEGTRRYLLRRYPFSVVYRVEPTRILIVAIAHAHRRPGYWKSRVRAAD